MNRSEQLNEIATALAKVQGSLHGAMKDSSNPHFRSKYADLESVWSACRKQLSDNGLSVTQVPTSLDGKTYLTTLLMHSSGQWIESRMELPIVKPGAQEVGSCLSYCRRYALAAMVGIYQTDDDGEVAEGRDIKESKDRIGESDIEMPRVKDPEIKMAPNEIKDVVNWHKSFPMIAPQFLSTYGSTNITSLPKEVYPLMTKKYKAAYAAKCQLEGKPRPSGAVS